MLQKVRTMVYTAILSSDFVGWALEFDDDYWFARASTRPLILMLLYIVWRVVSPIVVVIGKHILRDRLLRRDK